MQRRLANYNTTLARALTSYITILLFVRYLYPRVGTEEARGVHARYVYTRYLRSIVIILLHGFPRGAPPH